MKPITSEAALRAIEPEWLTIRETAAFLRVGEGVVKKLILQVRVHSVILKTQSTNARGVRLISLKSIRDYIALLQLKSAKGRRIKYTPGQLLALLPAASITAWRVKAKENLGISSATFYRLKSKVSANYESKKGSQPQQIRRIQR